MTVLFGALLAGAGGAAAGDKTDVVRDLGAVVGRIIGSALACRTSALAPYRSSSISSTARDHGASPQAERSDLTQILDRNVANGRGRRKRSWTD